MAEKKKSSYGYLFTGSVAGAVSRTVTNPLERLKMLQQVATPEYKGMGLGRSFAYMWEREGLYGFFKGNWGNCVKIMPFTACEFYFYAVYKNLVMGDHPESKLRKGICGGLTGMTAGFITHPFDLIRTHLAVNCKNFDMIGKNKPTIISTGTDLFMRQGVSGLYKGLCASLVGVTPYVAIKMAVFDIVNSSISVDKKSPYYLLLNLGLGGLVGSLSVGVTYPLEVIRRKMMLRGFEGYPDYSSFLDCTKKAYRAEGIYGLYRGILPCQLKIIPASALVFLVNDLLKT